jgi:glycosyltransferase involved in cell wall biosynthesis
MVVNGRGTLRRKNEFADIKVAICHEWLDNVGGGEKVLFEINSLFQDATIFTLWGNQEIAEKYNLNMFESFIRHLPARFRRNLGLALMPVAWASFSRKLRKFDLVITSSWAFAHACGRKNISSLNYIHTPGRYWWNPDIDSRTAIRLPKVLILILQKLDSYLAKNHGLNVANSYTTSNRIWDSWKQKSEVIHPPVDLDFFNFNSGSNSNNEEYLLGVSRFVTYKNLEFIIELGEHLRKPVVIAGHGPLYAKLLKRAEESPIKTSIIDSPSDEEIRNLYLNASYLIYPVIEDFGIVPVEAMGCGLQVIGIASGGLTETVVEGISGSLVASLDVEAFASAIENLPALNRGEIRSCVEKFSYDAFRNKLKELVNVRINAIHSN